MDFVTAVKTCFAKYVTFKGRAIRSEYWWFALFNVGVSVIAGLIDGSAHILSTLVDLALLLPGIAVGVRRLHDTDRSGWWWLIVFVPFVGIVVMIVFMCLKGSEGANRFG
jgi:uncharacterized membrane protein YhaH (DUF805 family)